MLLTAGAILILLPTAFIAGSTQLQVYSNISSNGTGSSERDRKLLWLNLAFCAVNLVYFAITWANSHQQYPSVIAALIAATAAIMVIAPIRARKK